jgi:hypothetical protein
VRAYRYPERVPLLLRRRSTIRHAAFPAIWCIRVAASGEQEPEFTNREVNVVLRTDLPNDVLWLNASSNTVDGRMEHQVTNSCVHSIGRLSFLLWCVVAFLALPSWRITGAGSEINWFGHVAFFLPISAAVPQRVHGSRHCPR